MAADTGKNAEKDVEELFEGFGEDPMDFGGEGAATDEIDPNIEALVQERDELKDRLLRALADAENIRKRAERDRRDAENYGGSKLARDILPVYDFLSRALDSVDDALKEQASALIEGIELTQRELIKVFHQHKIEKVEPAFGDKFDPNLHQAMFEAPVPNAPHGTVIQVMNPGFTIAGRLIRPAQVGVSSTPASSVKTEKPEAE